MKIKLPEKILSDDTYDIREHKEAGSIECENKVVEKIFFSFTESSLILNLIIKQENYKTMEMKINNGTLLVHNKSRVGIFNNKNKHYLLPETFWDDFIDVVIPFKFIGVKKCDFLTISFKFLEKNERTVYESKELKFQIKSKGEICTKM